jgi:hypothetical protein
MRSTINLALPVLKHGYGKAISNQSCLPKQAILPSRNLPPTTIHLPHHRSRLSSQRRDGAFNANPRGQLHRILEHVFFPTSRKDRRSVFQHGFLVLHKPQPRLPHMPPKRNPHQGALRTSDFQLPRRRTHLASPPLCAESQRRSNLQPQNQLTVLVRCSVLADRAKIRLAPAIS